MNWKTVFKNIYRWVLRAAAVLLIPSLFPSSVPMGDRVGWIGAVLLWLYMGRMVDRKKTQTQE